MILAAVEIENYKQYAGSHCIDFPEQGMVAITGPNGAGKTTLFEAIEWCLYGPRTIPHASIPPHGGVGATRVSVTLQDPHDGRRYVVRRTLRNGVSSAEAYSEDDPGQPVVQGPRDVSDFVARQLVGLPHAAFVSTFFTRQKELTFFGDRTPTERRVEVARLLGFQTIRDAQEEIGEERSDVRQEATSLRAQYERDAAGRDFEAEIAEAESAVTTAERLATTCQQQLTDADAAYAQAREELERWRGLWRGLQEQDAAYERELLTIAGVAQAATSRQEAAQAELRRLQALATERTALEPEAAQIGEIAQLVKTLEAERERSRRLETLRQGRQAHGAQLAETAVVLRRVVESHAEAASDLDGWIWSEADGGDPCQAAARLGRAVATLDPRALRLRAERLARAIDLANRTEAARRNLDQYRSHRSKLTTQRDEFLDKGEPGARLHAAEAAATGARAALEQAIGKLTEARQKRQESEELERIFDERTFNRICPTCTRPITDVEAARLLHSLRESTERVRAEEAAQVAALAAAQAQVATADAERAAANELMQKLASLNERLSDGERMIAELEAEHTRELAELDSILAAAGLHAPPHPTEVEAAQAAAERGAQLATLVGTLEQLGHRAAVARDGMLEADSEIMALGPVSYDEEAHQKAVSTLDAARHAAA
ncbi:MAG: hypothetical protein K0Q71_5640, partial [Thermomicrobiales bacterium]|nr:hypothetical protein [Thermomicrobiales bacterium]